MDFFYAQINADDIVFSVSQLAGEVTAPDMIRIQSLDTSLLGQRYADGTFNPVPAPTPEQ